jgi:hypothetical protein
MLLVVFPEMFRDRCGTNGPIVSGRGIQLPEIVYSDACMRLVTREISLHQALQIDEWDCVYAGMGYVSNIPLSLAYTTIKIVLSTSWGAISPH